MPPSITRDDVLRVAALAQLELTEADVELFAGQLGRILEYAGMVQQADTTTVAPPPDESHDAAWRADVPAPSLARDAALANAPDADRGAGLFRVPKVL